MRTSRTGSPAAVVYATVAASLMLAAGCGGPPQVDGHNRNLIVSLATAVSARDAAGLESHARLVEQRHSEGQLSGDQYEAFRQILTKARAADWRSAEEEVYALRDAQEPTSKDLENLAQRKLAPDHAVPKSFTKSRRR